jgi:shikimate kinase
MVIFLIGFMGSGKSWWAHRLAQELHVPNYDLDAVIEEAEGLEITDIFSVKGEGYFRQKERECLESLVEKLQRDETAHAGNWTAVISCGGGTPCFFDTMDWMNLHGLTVWLNPPVEMLAARLITETASRPLLAGKTGADLVELIDHLMEERAPFYEKARVQIKNTHLAMQDFINILEHAPDLP